MSHGVIVHVTWVQSTGLPSLICYGRGHAAGDSNLTVFFPVKYDRQSGNIYPRARCPRIWQQSSTTPTPPLELSRGGVDHTDHTRSASQQKLSRGRAAHLSVAKRSRFLSCTQQLRHTQKCAYIFTSYFLRNETAKTSILRNNLEHKRKHRSDFLLDRHPIMAASKKNANKPCVSIVNSMLGREHTIPRQPPIRPKREHVHVCERGN